MAGDFGQGRVGGERSTDDPQPTDTLRSLLQRKGLWLKWGMMKKGKDEAAISVEMEKWQALQPEKQERADARKTRRKVARKTKAAAAAAPVAAASAAESVPEPAAAAAEAPAA